MTRVSRRDGAQPLLDLDAPAATDPGRVGVKAATLARLRAAGEPVPAGVVVDPTADPAVAAAEVLERLGDVALAVRSSSPVEDLASGSHAGRYLTVLDVRGAQALQSAILAVRASAAELPALVREGPAMPVLVMPLVRADAAGVAFTANPVSGDDETVVEAVRGLGESLVSGAATPQRWIGVADATPSEVGHGPPALTADQAAGVARLAARVADALGGPQDVEWAIEDGRLHLLQARPITALPVAPADDAPGPREVWQRADQHFSGPIRPLMLSVWGPRFEETARKVFAEVGAPIETMRYRSIGGWMYLRAIAPMDRGRDDEPAPPALLFGLLLRVIPPLRRRLRTAARVWRSDIGSEAIAAWEDGGRDAMRRQTRDLRLVDRAALDDAALAAHLDDVLGHVQAASDVHFRLPVLATFLPMGRLGVLCERLLGWEPARIARLVQGHSGVVSGADAIDALVEAFAADPATARLLDGAPGALAAHPGPGGQALRAYLDRHGHEVVAMDLSHPTWAEDPSALLAIVRARMRRREVVRADAAAAAAEAEAQARAALAGKPVQLEAFAAALADARRGIGYGDDTEPDVLQALAVVRYVAVEAGRRLAARELLPDADAVFSLTVDELREGLVEGRLRVDVQRRRAEHRWALAHPGPARYGPPPPAWPSMRYAPKRARDFLEAMVWITAHIDGPPAGGPPATDGAANADGSAASGVAGTANLSGIPASPGRATGTVRIIRDPSQFDAIRPGDILVCPSTIASWSVVFGLVGAIVTELGGPLSHPGILAREFGLPAVLSVPRATTLLHDGQVVTVDGATGVVEPA